jgi:hypothetical protein
VFAVEPRRDRGLSIDADDVTLTGLTVFMLVLAALHLPQPAPPAAAPQAQAWAPIGRCSEWSGLRKKETIQRRTTEA